MPDLTTLRPLTTVLALCATILSAPVLAQTTETPPADPGDSLSLGEATVDATAVGQPYDKEKQGDWTMRCIKVEEGEDPCQMYQLMTDDQQVPIAEFSLFRLPADGEAKAGATVIVPLETSLAAQLTVQVDSNPAKRYPFSFCNSIGCYARIGLTQEDVDAFKKGAKAVITIVPIVAPDQRVTVNLSLKGFTAGFDAASVVER
jgi:invasion protein IalB